MTGGLMSGAGPTLELWQFAALAVISFLGAVLGGVSGFGAGLIVTPFLVPIVGVKGVVPVMAVAMTLGNMSRAWVYRSKIERKPILQILIAAIPGAALGTYLYDLLPRDPLAIAIGVFLLASIPLRRILTRRKVTPTPRAILGVSAGFGVVSGALPGGGIMLMPLLLGIGLSGGGLVGTDAVVGVLINVSKALFLNSLGLLDVRLFLGGLLVGLCMIPGAYGARWLIDRLHVKVHTAIIEVLVAGSGISFIWSAFREMT
ncbi:hypothetical protein GCM10007276_18150 [Agaricicola taiwanensis]|uniref:Probable membrane transporter protein n=1 Tax=Agaricicola taiwanensis TaxID=591372 RepID=A0A8J2YDW2_9RHOB|nr:sulfite exporter TauE/SafE family protein [Agaricicola taiwanensis]GGE41130.1 hypothetical protein GCM10007276_18150 [Agaricicola taiwanensis]